VCFALRDGYAQNGERHHGLEGGSRLTTGCAFATEATSVEPVPPQAEDDEANRRDRRGMRIDLNVPTAGMRDASLWGVGLNGPP